MAELEYLHASGVDASSAVMQELLEEAATAATAAMISGGGRHDAAHSPADTGSDGDAHSDAAADADADPLYDATMDDTDSAWVAAQRAAEGGEAAAGGAALSCPSCFAVVALYSAPHAASATVFRTHAARGVTVEEDVELPLAGARVPDRGTRQLTLHPVACGACGAGLGGWHAGTREYWFTDVAPAEADAGGAHPRGVADPHPSTAH